MFKPKLNTAILSKKFLFFDKKATHQFLDTKIATKYWSKNNQQGINQSDLEIPYTDQKDLQDHLLYTINNDSKEYFIPIYKMDMHRISGSQQFKVQLLESTEGEGGMLKVSLKIIPNENIKNNLTNALPFDQKPLVTLQLISPVTRIERNFNFQEVVKTDIGYDLNLRITSIEELSKISIAISDSAYQCKLLVSTTHTIAVPKYFSSSTPQNPILNYTKKETVNVSGREFIKIHLAIENWNTFSDDFFKPAPELPPCGNNKNASRTWLEIFDDKAKRLYGYCALKSNKSLYDFSFGVLSTNPMPNTCYVVLWDRKTNKKYISNKIGVKGEPSIEPLKIGEKVYTKLTKKFTYELDFNLPQDMYLNLVGKRENITEGFSVYHLNFDEDGSEHLYIQDLVSPEKFHFFPDYYAIARESNAPFRPLLGAEILGEDVDNLKVKIDYRAEAFTNQARIDSALRQLQEHPNINKNNITLSLPPWGGNQFKLKLFLPKGEGLSERSDSSVTSENIADIFNDVSLDDFQEFLTQLCAKNAVSNMFTGYIDVHLPGIPIAPIPVLSSMIPITGDMLVTGIKSNISFLIEIKNLSEKNLSAQGLFSQIHDGVSIVDGSQTNLQLPIALKPGETITFNIIPEGIIENPNEALVKLTWEGLKEYDNDQNFRMTTESFIISNQSMHMGGSFQILNPTESIINAKGIEVFTADSSKKKPLALKNVPSPVVINPGEVLSFEAITDYGLSVGESNLFINWIDFESVPNLQSLYECVVDTSVNNTYEVEVKIQLHFDIKDELSKIRNLKVLLKGEEEGAANETIFERSDSLNEHSGFVEKKIVLRQSLKDYVLKIPNNNSYWYKIVAVNDTDISGESEEVEGLWMKAEGKHLNITTDKIPKTEKI